MKHVLKVILGALLVIAGVLLLMAALAFALWLMVPLAFPGLSIWSFGNAWALSWMIVLVGLPWLVKD